MPRKDSRESEAVLFLALTPIDPRLIVIRLEEFILRLTPLIVIPLQMLSQHIHNAFGKRPPDQLCEGESALDSRVVVETIHVEGTSYAR